MIAPQKQLNAIRVLHDVVIRARFSAYEEKSWTLVSSLLDYADHLMNLMTDAEDKTESFAECIEVMAENPDLMLGGLIERFES